MAITNFKIGNEIYPIGVNIGNVEAADNIEYVENINNIDNVSNIENINVTANNTFNSFPHYTGVNLADKGYTWETIKEKVNMGDLSDFNVSDYMPLRIQTIVPYSGINIPVDYTLIMEIAGIDTYEGTFKMNGENVSIHHHIDWISKDLFPVLKAAWATTNDKLVIKNDKPTNTSSDAANPFPYLNSNIKAFLNDTIFNLLPDEVKNIISSKKMVIEKRYSTDGTTYYTSASGEAWADVGKIWLPSEFEVIGTVMFGDRQHSAGMAVQYPIFAHNVRSRIKNRIKAQVDETTGYPIFDENGNLALYNDGSEGWATMTICAKPWVGGQPITSDVNVESIITCLNKIGGLSTSRIINETVFPLCFRIEQDA